MHDDSTGASTERRSLSPWFFVYCIALGAIVALIIGDMSWPRALLVAILVGMFSGIVIQIALRFRGRAEGG